MATLLKQTTNFTLGTSDKDKSKFYSAIPSAYQGKVVKIGYCCEEEGFELPIKVILANDDDSSDNDMTIKPYGMFELQQETIVKDNEEIETDFKIQDVMVPGGIHFTLDYVVVVN